MISNAPRTLGYYAATQWFQWAVLFVAIALLLVVGILPALNDAKARAEKGMVELTLRNMRTGMQLAMGEALMHQRESEMATWAGSDPVHWLSTPPDGYQGACPTAGYPTLEGGQWCFSEASRELIYQPRRADYLRSISGAQEVNCPQLRWRVTRAANAAGGGFVGLSIESVSLCQWQVPGR